MAVPTHTLRVDWVNNGTFTGPFDTVAVRNGPGESVRVSRGGSAEFNAEASSEMSFFLDNRNHAYTPDRNWLDNPSFEEAGTTGWSTVTVTSITVTATSITQVTDNAGQGGTKAAEAVLTSTNHSGVTYLLPFSFKAGLDYSFRFWLKSMSGTLSVRAGLASIADPTTSIDSTSTNITTSWAAYTGTYTPTEDCLDVVVFVRTTTASAATVRIDAIQINPGSTLNTYLEAPTKGQITPGRPVHYYTTLAAVDTAKFFGYIKTISPDPANQRVKVTCHDPFKLWAGTDIGTVTTFGVDSAKNLRSEVADALGVVVSYDGNREAADILEPTASVSGNGLAALERINSLVLSRHFILPTMTTPWYSYKVVDRVFSADMSVDATFADMTIQGWDDLELDESSIINSVTITYTAGSATYIDAVSIASFGIHAISIDGDGIYPSATVPALVGAAYLARYAFPRARPVMRLEQQYALQQSLDLNDVIVVTIAAFLLVTRPFRIIREDLEIARSGTDWQTTYQLEEY